MYSEFQKVSAGLVPGISGNDLIGVICARPLAIETSTAEVNCRVLGSTVAVVVGGAAAGSSHDREIRQDHRGGLKHELVSSMLADGSTMVILLGLLMLILGLALRLRMKARVM